MNKDPLTLFDPVVSSIAPEITWETFDPTEIPWTYLGFFYFIFLFGNNLKLTEKFQEDYK